ncbi:MAG: hypothetical protein AAF721_37410 [Myxococcota bacterium]
MAVLVSLGLVVVAAALGWHDVMLSGPLLLLGWIIFGFGAGEAVMGDRLRIVRMLLALMVGIFGMAFSFWLIRALGFSIRAQ